MVGGHITAFVLAIRAFSVHSGVDESHQIGREPKPNGEFSMSNGVNRRGQKRRAGEENSRLSKRRCLEGERDKIKLERRKATKRRAHTSDMEERQFSEMVEKYREKLSRIG